LKVCAGKIHRDAHPGVYKDQLQLTAQVSTTVL
jgi:hypothetical protein